MQELITKNFEETKMLGKEMAKKFQGGEIICLEGELGAGKTTFSQGLLEGLGVKGPYTSPTFVVMKNYQKDNSESKDKIKNIYHIDTYRVETEDVLDLGWEEITNDEDAVVIVEWPEKIKKIIPKKAIWIKIKSLDKNTRKFLISKKYE